MFAKKPIIGLYSFHTTEDMSKGMNLNTFHGENGETYSFRCPNKRCGRPVKVGYPVCPFCGERLKWKYPFKIIKVE